MNMSITNEYFTLLDDLKYLQDQTKTIFLNRDPQGLKKTNIEKSQEIMLNRCLKFLRENSKRF